MNTRKTLRVVVGADGVPVAVGPHPLDKTREIPTDETVGAVEVEQPRAVEAVPQEVVDGEVTVPVQSSIESTLTFEMLRRQSGQEDDDTNEKKP